MIYGDSGLGKTHLGQAIGILVKEKHPDKTVLYVNANKFQTQFVESVRNNSKNDFLHFYQMIDVLILDDVHEFAGKEKTQDTFFHIFQSPASVRKTTHSYMRQAACGIAGPGTEAVIKI
jgi:chromosomal replication initiator protein